MTKAPLAVRRLSGTLLVGILTVVMLVATAPASTSSPSSAADKIDRALAAQLAGGRSAPFTTATAPVSPLRQDTTMCRRDRPAVAAMRRRARAPVENPQHRTTSLA